MYVLQNYPQYFTIITDIIQSILVELGVSKCVEIIVGPIVIFRWIRHWNSWFWYIGGQNWTTTRLNIRLPNGFDW